MGVWIEIECHPGSCYACCVTPCVGVWIEITYYAIKHGKGIVTPCVGVYLAQYILNSNFAL